jgi:hypothetical protein
LGGIGRPTVRRGAERRGKARSRSEEALRTALLRSPVEEDLALEASPPSLSPRRLLCSERERGIPFPKSMESWRGRLVSALSVGSRINAYVRFLVGQPNMVYFLSFSSVTFFYRFWNIWWNKKCSDSEISFWKTV